MTNPPEELNEFGRQRLEDDFLHRDWFSGDRGKRGSEDDFAAGWMSLAARHRLWSYFTAEARARLEAIAECAGVPG